MPKTLNELLHEQGIDPAAEISRSNGRQDTPAQDETPIIQTWQDVKKWRDKNTYHDHNDNKGISWLCALTLISNGNAAAANILNVIAWWCIIYADDPQKEGGIIREGYRWIVLNAKDLFLHTGLQRRQIDRARKWLESEGLILRTQVNSKYHGGKLAPAYRVDFDRFIPALNKVIQANLEGDHDAS